MGVDVISTLFKVDIFPLTQLSGPTEDCSLDKGVNQNEILVLQHQITPEKFL